MTVSVVIPALNEEQGIGATLDALFRVRGDLQIIVVDGGSSDETTKVVEQRGVRLVRSAPGRGVQMHNGALLFNGEVLWFLHADTHPPADAVEYLVAALKDPSVAGGNFALRFSGSRRPANLLTRAYPHFRKLGLIYGDSGVFLRRSVYEELGGFKPYPIFEDLDLIRGVKRLGRFVHVPCELVTSSRRFEGRSFSRTFARWTFLQVLYWMGVPPARLGRLYHPLREKQ